MIRLVIILLFICTALNGQFTVSFQNTYSNRSAGAYTEAMHTVDNNGGLYEWGLPGNVDIIDEGGDKLFHVKFPIGTRGSGGGLSVEAQIPGTLQEAYLTYNLRFKTGFDFVGGGKLFGFKDGIVDILPTPPYGDPRGFFAGVMWKPDGTIQSYIYHAAQTAQYGEGGNWTLNGGFTIIPGEWFNITIRIVMNDIGYSNGIYEAFVNKKLVFQSQHYEFKTTSSVWAHLVKMNSFFGGDGAIYNSTANEYIDFDDITVYNYATPTSGLSSVSRILILPIALKTGTAPTPNVATKGKSIRIGVKNYLYKIGTIYKTIRF